MALVAACIAFGNVKAIRAKLDDLLARLGPSPARAADDPASSARPPPRLEASRLPRRGRREAARRRARAPARARLARRPLRARAGRGDAALREALAAWCDAIRARAVCARTDRDGDPRTSCPIPGARAGASASSSTCAGWSVPPTASISVSGTSTPRVCSFRSTSTSTASPETSGSPGGADSPGARPRRSPRRWRASTPGDPVGYDFSLCHMGMLQRCPSRRDPVRCEGCGVQPVCIHWQRARKDSTTRKNKGSAKVAGPAG